MHQSYDKIWQRDYHCRDIHFRHLLAPKDFAFTPCFKSLVAKEISSNCKKYWNRTVQQLSHKCCHIHCTTMQIGFFHIECMYSYNHHDGYTTKGIEIMFTLHSSILYVTFSTVYLQSALMKQAFCTIFLSFLQAFCRQP